MKDYILLLPIIFIFHDMEEIIGFGRFFKKNPDLFERFPKVTAPYRDFRTAGFALADPTANEDPATSLRVQSLRALAGDPARLWAYWGTAAVFLPRAVATQFVQAGAARVAGLYDFGPGQRLVRAADLRSAPVAMLEPVGVPPSVAVYHGWRGIAENASPADVFAAIVFNEFIDK